MFTIRMNRLLAPHHPAGNLNRPVRDHLVDVHVRLRPTARLPYPQRKMLVQLPRNHLVRRLRNQPRLLPWQLPQILIHQRRRIL